MRHVYHITKARERWTSPGWMSSLIFLWSFRWLLATDLWPLPVDGRFWSDVYRQPMLSVHSVLAEDPKVLKCLRFLKLVDLRNPMFVWNYVGAFLVVSALYLNCCNMLFWWSEMPIFKNSFLSIAIFLLRHSVVTLSGTLRSGPYIIVKHNCTQLRIACFKGYHLFYLLKFKSKLCVDRKSTSGR